MQRFECFFHTFIQSVQTVMGNPSLRKLRQVEKDYARLEVWASGEQRAMLEVGASQGTTYKT